MTPLQNPSESVRRWRNLVSVLPFVELRYKYVDISNSKYLNETLSRNPLRKTNTDNNCLMRFFFFSLKRFFISSLHCSFVFFFYVLRIIRLRCGPSPKEDASRCNKSCRRFFGRTRVVKSSGPISPPGLLRLRPRHMTNQQPCQPFPKP